MESEIIKELIEKILEGNRDLFVQIVDQYKNRIYRLCLSLLKNSSAAEDTTQEIFIKIYESLTGFQFRSSFSTWVYSIAYYTCIDKLRQAKHEHLSLDNILAKKGDLVSDQQSSSFMDSIEKREIIEQVEERMPAEYMRLLHLKITHNYTYQEIAEIMRISVNAVKGKLKRARKKFIKIYRHFDKDYPTK